jgi:hypothetical protein
MMPFKVSSPPLFLSSGANCLLPDSRRCMQMLARQKSSTLYLTKNAKSSCVWFILFKRLLQKPSSSASSSCNPQYRHSTV